MTWLDHTFYFGEWDPTKGFSQRVSVGILAYEDEGRICVAQGYDMADRKFSEVMVIDKRTVIRRRWVKEA